MDGETIKVASVSHANGAYVVVAFTDGTVAQYNVEELLRIKPEREPSGESGLAQ